MPIDFEPEIEFEPENSMDPYYVKAKEGLEGIGGAIMGGVGAVAEKVDKYNPLGAPLRAGIGAAQDDKPVVEAYLNQYLREPSAAPSGKQIAAKAGLSEEGIDTPFISNPFTRERFQVSPAGVGGGVIESLDPTMVVPAIAAEKVLLKGAGMVERVAPRLAETAGRFAEERAVKAATGESKKSIRKLAKVNGQSPGDVNRAIGNLRSTGRTLLEADEAGAPAVGWMSNAEDIGRNAEAKRKFYGKQIGSVGPVVDRLAPGAITPQELALDVSQFQREIPNLGKGAPVRKRVGEEAGRLERYGMAEDDLGPAKPLSFADAQEMKSQYPWNPQSSDLLISDKDATTRINRIIDDKMGNAVGKAQAGNASPEDLAILNQYAPAKQKYGVYKGVADAGTEQAMNTLNRRMISPSSHAMGLGAGLATAGQGLQQAGITGALAGLANQVALSRGSAFAARASDAISKKLMQAPGKYQKWLPTMRNAAKVGNAAVVSTHHQLMANDPDYRRLMQQAEEP